jgi:hypothetical protein
MVFVDPLVQYHPALKRKDNITSLEHEVKKG